MIVGTVQVVTGPDGYLDPAKPPAQLSGLGARMLIGLLAMNAAGTAANVARVEHRAADCAGVDRSADRC